jgi:hypothetical protein
MCERRWKESGRGVYEKKMNGKKETLKARTRKEKKHEKQRTVAEPHTVTLRALERARERDGE